MAPAKKRQSKGKQKNGKAKAKAFGLPFEITAAILALLDFRDILMCQRVSKDFNQVIRESVQLQYTIELGVANYVDGPAEAKLAVGDRLKLLKQSQETWKDFDFKLKKLIEPGKAVNQWAFCGGVLVLTYLDDNTQTTNRNYQYFDNIMVCYVRSGGPEPEFETCCFDETFTDFAMDPSQDLIVLWDRSSVSDEDGLSISFRTLSTLDPHDRAKDGYVDLPFHDPGGGESVQIFGDLVVAIGFMSSKIILMDWTTGAKRTLSGCFTGGCLLSDSCLVVAKMVAEKKDLCLDVYAIKRTKKHALTLTLAAHFELPALREQMVCDISFASFGSSASSGIPASDGEPDPARPFSTSPIPSMVLLKLRVDHEYGHWLPGNYAVFAETILFLSVVGDVLSHRKRKPTTFSWEEWGPDSTWWFDGNTVGSDTEWKEARWKDAMHGFRVMLPDSILDFNVVDIMRSLAELSAEDEDSDAEFMYETDWHTTIKKGTVAPDSDTYFVKKVRTYAPYRRTELSETSLSESYYFYMLDE
ncbi:hypothetical protein BKA93DRAFT_822641 [Sparassis latifolia]|uniref:F-box domain-containing protein n=1 Tax=Sparassis crispa TaxID=139825 RepID=A0A401GH66_9APHY|nr:hypothetical protein SCP_0312380 [Sparassis crispa]GBE81509.1 hypothetical protein SCP_0312380 [Sparassis crispa]